MTKFEKIWIWINTNKKIDRFLENNGHTYGSKAEAIDQLIDIGIQFEPNILILENRRERQARLKKRTRGRPKKIMPHY